MGLLRDKICTEGKTEDVENNCKAQESEAHEANLAGADMPELCELLVKQRPAATLEMPQRLQRTIRIICDARGRPFLGLADYSASSVAGLIDQASIHGCLRVCSDAGWPTLMRSRLAVWIERQDEQLYTV